MFVRSYCFHASHQYTLRVIIIGGKTTHRRCLVFMLAGCALGLAKYTVRCWLANLLCALNTTTNTC